MSATALRTASSMAGSARRLRATAKARALYQRSRVALPLDEAVGHLEADAVAAGAAGLDLVEQLLELRLAGHSRRASRLSQWRSALARRSRDRARKRGHARAAMPAAAMSDAATSASKRRGPGRVAGRAREGLAELRQGLGERRQHLPADAVARVAQVGVARVVDEGDAARRDPARAASTACTSSSGRWKSMPWRSHLARHGRPGRRGPRRGRAR